MNASSHQAIRVHIRWMIRRDMAEVLEIEQRCFEFPWSEQDFMRCLRQRNCIGMVAEQGDRVVGFMIYELHKNRLHILNFAVANQMHRSGIGRQMIDKLIGKLSTQRRTRITLEVRPTNDAAIRLYEGLGFTSAGRRPRYYQDNGEDAVIMWRTPATLVGRLDDVPNAQVG